MPSLISLTSSRLSITPKRNPKPLDFDAFNNKYCKDKKDLKVQYLENFAKPNNPFVLSKASKRKLFDSINYLYSLSPKRTITMQTGKCIYNYRMSFITLTLPAKQCHGDTFIKSNFLNQFLVELRRNYGLTNYVCKAELQKNENIHFHLLIDRYIDYQALRRRWNRCIEKGGYVSKYQKKMSNLTPSDYFKLRLDNCIKHNEKYGTNHTITFQESFKAYTKGKECNWKNPNTVDVKSVYGKKDLAMYLSKYICKPSDENAKDDALTERQKTFGRSWTRSYSLVKMCNIGKIEYDDIKDLIAYFRSQKNKIKRISGQFFEVFYFQLDNLHETCRKYILDWLLRIAHHHGYIIPP